MLEAWKPTVFGFRRFPSWFPKILQSSLMGRCGTALLRPQRPRRLLGVEILLGNYTNASSQKVINSLPGYLVPKVRFQKVTHTHTHDMMLTPRQHTNPELIKLGWEREKDQLHTPSKNGTRPRPSRRYRTNFIVYMIIWLYIYILYAYSIHIEPQTYNN